MKLILPILYSLEVVALLGAAFCFVKASYHGHQAKRILNQRGRQTFWQWIKHIDTERGVGIWK